MRGVNLGGWLVLEKWITPSLFADVEADDEYTFCVEDAKKDYEKLREHRQNFISKADFEWLASHNINAVRIPVGYWALNDDKPFINCQEQLDNVFGWAADCGLKILLDLHALPGSQNGLDHSGKIGSIEWSNKPNMDLSLDSLTELAQRYGDHPALWGISLVNEPNIKLSSLKNFYMAGYEAVRRVCGESVAVIISDSFKPQRWNGFMTEPNYKNVILDMHLYQCFSPKDKKLDINGHITKAHDKWSKFIKKSDKPVIVGEWSLALDPQTYHSMNDAQKNQARQAYAKAQIDVFNRSAGWFYWTYKTEGLGDWNFRYLTERELI